MATVPPARTSTGPSASNELTHNLPMASPPGEGFLVMARNEGPAYRCPAFRLMPGDSRRRSEVGERPILRLSPGESCHDWPREPSPRDVTVATTRDSGAMRACLSKESTRRGDSRRSGRVEVAPDPPFSGGLGQQGLAIEQIDHAVDQVRPQRVVYLAQSG